MAMSASSPTAPPPSSPPPAPAGPPLTPIINLFVLDSNGNPVRNDNLTNFAYVGPNDNQAQPPEVYNAYRPANPADPTLIQPGETTQLRNVQTGKYCRLAQLPSTYPMAAARLTKSTGNSAGITAKRGLMQAPSSCATQGVICDQDTIATATILTYTGSGLSYNGVPLVQSPPSKTLVLSSDPACTVPNGAVLSFPPATLCECCAIDASLAR